MSKLPSRVFHRRRNISPKLCELSRVLWPFSAKPNSPTSCAITSYWALRFFRDVIISILFVSGDLSGHSSSRQVLVSLTSLRGQYWAYFGHNFHGNHIYFCHGNTRPLFVPLQSSNTTARRSEVKANFTMGICFFDTVTTLILTMVLIGVSHYFLVVSPAITIN